MRILLAAFFLISPATLHIFEITLWISFPPKKNTSCTSVKIEIKSRVKECFSLQNAIWALIGALFVVMRQDHNSRNYSAVSPSQVPQLPWMSVARGLGNHQSQQLISTRAKEEKVVLVTFWSWVKETVGFCSSLDTIHLAFIFRLFKTTFCQNICKYLLMISCNIACTLYIFIFQNLQEWFASMYIYYPGVAKHLPETGQ